MEFEYDYHEFESLSVTQRMLMIDDWQSEIDRNLVELKDASAKLSRLAKKQSGYDEKAP